MNSDEAQQVISLLTSIDRRLAAIELVLTHPPMVVNHGVIEPVPVVRAPMRTAIVPPGAKRLATIMPAAAGAMRPQRIEPRSGIPLPPEAPCDVEPNPQGDD